jgi:phosphatidylserine synthase
MVSTIRFRSFKTIDLEARRSYKVPLAVAIAFFAIATYPRPALVVLAYAYLMSAFIGLAWTRLRRRGSPARGRQPADASDSPAENPS